MKNYTLILLSCIYISINTAMGSGYTVQPGDVLSISVWKEQDLQQLVLVRPDGGISFPLVGELSAQGSTVEDLRQEITRKLSKYIPDVQVNVALQELNGNLVYVVGKVNRPGVYPFNRNVDVVQALGMAEAQILLQLLTILKCCVEKVIRYGLFLFATMKSRKVETWNKISSCKVAIRLLFRRATIADSEFIR